MASYNQNGRDAQSDENRASWRPEDQSAQARYRGSDRSFGDEDDRDYRSFRDRNFHDQDRHAANRDPRRWEGSRGSELGYHEDRDTFGRGTEAYHQGYGQHRYGDDHSNRYSRNDWSPSRFDDRFTGRARSWPAPGDDGERYGRSFDADRQRGSWRPYDERMGYDGGQNAGYSRSGYGQVGWGGWRGYDQANDGVGNRGYGQDYGPRGDGYGQTGNQGYGGYVGYGGSADQRFGMSESQRRFGSEGHSHHGSGPHRGKGPVGYQRSDERLREMICETLADDDQVDASQIEVTVRNGEVTLTGTVEDRRTKREAEECACTVSGVRDVQNQLRVRNDRKSQSAQPGTPSVSSHTSYANGTTESDAFAQDKKPRA